MADLFPMPVRPPTVKKESTPFNRRAAKQKLLEMVLPALETVERIMASGDDKEDNLSFKAACTILDRAGFGTHSSITVEDNTTDIHNLPLEEILAKSRQVQLTLEKKALLQQVTQSIH